jgi:hypothetical protein
VTTLAKATDRTTAHRAPGADRAAIPTLATTGCTRSYNTLRDGK